LGIICYNSLIVSEKECEMRGRYDPVSGYEYNQARDKANSYSKVADNYRTKYLNLRKMLREFQKHSGVVFPEHIKKAIGSK
jgi:hypothetical protein